MPPESLTPDPLHDEGPATCQPAAWHVVRGCRRSGGRKPAEAHGPQMETRLPEGQAGPHPVTEWHLCSCPKTQMPGNPHRLYVHSIAPPHC